jgi:preprotein translocase subunit SecF
VGGELAVTVLYWLLTAVAGGLVAGLVRVPLRVEERVALALVTGILGGAVCALGLATIFGIGVLPALGGPVLLGLIGLLGCVLTGGVWVGWRESLAEVPERWRSR